MKEQLFDYEEQHASAHDDLVANLFITAGGLEAALQERIQRMVDRLRSRRYPELEVQTHVFEGEGHTSAYAASVSRALRELYRYS